jgi:hypothetical protein
MTRSIEPVWKLQPVSGPLAKTVAELIVFFEIIICFGNRENSDAHFDPRRGAGWAVSRLPA